MADNKKWFKVWTDIMTNPEFDDLDNSFVGAWVRLGALVAKLGKSGIVTVSENQMIKRVNCDAQCLAEIADKLKLVNVSVVDNRNDTWTVTFHNWAKYHVDSTNSEQQKKHREKVNSNATPIVTVTGENKKKIKTLSLLEEEDTQQSNSSLKKGKSTPKTKGTVKPQDVIARYCELFKERSGINPVLSPKDAGTAKRLAKLPHILEVIESFFASEDDFIKRNGYTINLVESRYNALVVTIVSTPQPREIEESPQVKYLREQRELEAIPVV